MGRAGAPGAAALGALPFVGIVLGAAAGSIGWLVSLIAPLPLAAAFAFAATLVLSGAIHLDGYLDCCDALFASVDVSRRFEILKDPRHGTFALAGLAVLVPVWLAALVAVPAPLWPWLLAFCGGAARLVSALNALRFPYASGGASARVFDERPALWWFGAATAACIACCWPRPALALLIAPAALASVGIAAWCARRLDGVLVGDCYGAAIVMIDAGLLAASAAVIGHAA